MEHYLSRVKDEWGLQNEILVPLPVRLPVSEGYMKNFRKDESSGTRTA
jgi:hypothetical protein